MPTDRHACPDCGANHPRRRPKKQQPSALKTDTDLTPNRCHHCQAPVITGRVESLDLTLDPRPLNQLGHTALTAIPDRLLVSINRTIRRSFDGRYSVSIWKDPPDGHVACAGSDTLRYRGGLFEPHEAPLTQWADDPWCARIPEGRYYAEVCWTILRPFFGIVPDKTICTTSNMFSVLPRED